MESKSQWKGSVAFETAHQTLSAVCIEYLLLPDCQWGQNKIRPRAEVKDLEKWEAEQSLRKAERALAVPFHDYANDSWHDHVLEGRVPHDTLLIDLCERGVTEDHLDEARDLSIYVGDTLENDIFYFQDRLGPVDSGHPIRWNIARSACHGFDGLVQRLLGNAKQEERARSIAVCGGVLGGHVSVPRKLLPYDTLDAECHQLLSKPLPAIAMANRVANVKIMQELIRLKVDVKARDGLGQNALFFQEFYYSAHEDSNVGSNPYEVE